MLAHAASCLSATYLSVPSDISLGLPSLSLSLGGLQAVKTDLFNFTLTFDLVAVGSCTYTTIAPATHQLFIFSALHPTTTLLFFPPSPLSDTYQGFTLYIHPTQMENEGT